MAAPGVIGPDESKAWLAFLAGMDHEYGHRPEYSAAASAVTGLKPLLWTYEGPAGKVACALAMRAAPGGFDIVTPLGFAGFAINGSVPELAEVWTTDWRQRGAIAAYVQLSPFEPPAAWREALGPLASDLHPAQDCWCWDLQADEERLLGGMSSKHRQLLRKWLREDPQVVWDQKELGDRFNVLYGDFLAREAIPPVFHYRDDATRHITHSPGALYVGIREPGGAIEAITVFLSSGTRADSFLNAASIEGRRHSRGLYWLGSLHLQRQGVRRLNLGGGIRAGDGLSEFKERLGAHRSPTLALKQVFDPERYQAACEVAGVDAATESYFPAWRRPAGR